MTAENCDDLGIPVWSTNMRYGKKPTDGMWRMTIQLRESPFCPGCNEELQGVVVEIRNGWAWCPICVATLMHRDKLIRYVLATDEFRAHATRQNGLYYYTPRFDDGQVKTATEFGIDMKRDLPVSTAAELPGTVNLLLPSGIHDAKTLDFKGLAELEQEMKALRNRKCDHNTEKPANQESVNTEPLEYGFKQIAS